MLRIAMIGIAGVLLALQVKALKPEYGIHLCLAVSLLVFLQMTDPAGNDSCRTSDRTGKSAPAGRIF